MSNSPEPTASSPQIPTASSLQIPTKPTKLSPSSTSPPRPKIPYTDNPTNTTGDHLCVLIHGLWGNPTHWGSLTDHIRLRYDSSKLHILACGSNTGPFTYDGIETGGERVAREIEEAIEKYGRDGVEIRKISIVGYSLGGLVARYAIGLLYSKGYFQRIKPVNYTSFASPHLGVRTPLLGWHNHLWNVLGARTVSMSGRQLFLIDKFRGTERPLIAVLADKDSVFFKGLMMFETRCLYANVVNDPATCFYTSAISRCDPFASMDNVDFNYVPKYDPIIIDLKTPVTPLLPESKEKVPIAQKIGQTTSGMTRLPQALIRMIVFPIGILFFLANAMFQTVFSHHRIRSHNGNTKYGYHKLPVFATSLGDDLQEAAEQLIEHFQSAPEHLTLEEEEENRPPAHEQEPLLDDKMVGITDTVKTQKIISSTGDDASEVTEYANVATHRSQVQTEFPTLALHPTQFQMIHNLNSLAWKKFPVWIHDEKQSHAAIIMRKPLASWGEKLDEGRVVLNHWLDEVFEV